MRSSLPSLLLAGVLTTACDSPGGEKEDALAGRDFLSTTVEGRTLVDGTRISLRFRGEEGLTVSAGCNTIFAETYVVEDARLQTGEFGWTEIGCEEPYHAQDDWLTQFLGASPRLELAGDELTLSDDLVTVHLLDREVADPDRPLTGRLWTVNALLEGEGIGSVQTPIPATLEFRDDGIIVIGTPCAAGEASYTTGPGILELSQVVLPPPFCPEEPGTARIDDHMRRVLVAGQTMYEIDAARLEILNGTVGLYLTTP